MKYGTQIGALGKPDMSEALDYARSLGCEGLEVGLNVAGLRTGAVKLADLLAEVRRKLDSPPADRGRWYGPRERG